MVAISIGGEHMELELITSKALTLRDSLLQQAGMTNKMNLLDRFVTEAPATGPTDHYKCFTAIGKKILEDVLVESGESGQRVFLRAAILHGVARTSTSNFFLSLPDRVISQQISQFKRIVTDVNVDADWLSIDKDLFHKEFGIATLRLYVAGAQLVDPRCGLPRSLLFRGPVTGWLRNIVNIVKLGGFNPYFQIHTHQFMLDTFNPDGWNECYRCCAELYKVHPDVLGMYGGSWFYDPALDAISPRLSYLRDIPQQGGAHLFFVERGGSALGNALSTSSSRRALYETGKYMPTNYMLVWGKDEQYAWAKSSLRSSAVAV